MKKEGIKKIMNIVVLVYCCIACDADFETPTPKSIEIPEGAMISITAAKAGLDRIADNTTTFTTDQLMEAYVVSTDKGGNFFKELILQDRPNKPTSGIHFLLDERALHNRFPFGSKIVIQLNGLSVGFGNGVVKLGKLQENEIVALTAFEIDQHVFRTNEVVAIEPLELSIHSLTREKESMLIKLTNMQFSSNFITETPKTLAAESSDNFDGLRPMLSCAEGVELSLCTSTFASFKSLALPQGSGEVVGVLGRDFRDDFFVLKMNSAADLSFESDTRCDPVFFDCKPVENKSKTLLFSEDFETITNEEKLERLGWINVNVTGDEKRWADKKITNVNNRVLTISAFNTNLRPLEAWLITPEIDLTMLNEATLEFKVRSQFNNGKILNVWITNNFKDNPKSTLWELLPVKIPRASSNYKVITQNISCISGKVRVGFQYKGFDPLATSTYQIDDVQFY
ncbi:DUF5689 domain-containing protein [Aquimarina agarilytica]|uniref:DUF5689 domain-containing protein n=1 Tax=Aquimarina agarilytica TaxID=1087449 RepID=UPI00028836EB|nr:DUF5689 domain-containing protein [Aquimarina agarilytica]